MKTIHKKAILTVFTLSLFACSSMPVEKVNTRIKAWNGQPVETLIKFWGLPSKQHQVADNHYAEWTNKRSEPGNMSVSIGGGRSSGHTGLGVGLNLLGLGDSDDSCSRLVTYDSSNRVTDIIWQGDNDFCFELTPDLAKMNKNQTATK